MQKRVGANERAAGLLERIVNDGGGAAAEPTEAALAQGKVVGVQRTSLRGPRPAQGVDPHVIDPHGRLRRERGGQQGNQMGRELRVTRDGLPHDLHIHARQLLGLRFDEAAVRLAGDERHAPLSRIEVIEKIRDAPVTQRVVERSQLVEHVSAPNVRRDHGDDLFEAAQRLAAHKQTSERGSLRRGGHPFRLQRQFSKYPSFHRA